MQVDSRLDLGGVTSLRADDVPSVDYYPGFAGGHYLRLKLEAVSASCESRLTPARCSLISIHNSGPEYIMSLKVFSVTAHTSTIRERLFCTQRGRRIFHNPGVVAN